MNFFTFVLKWALDEKIILLSAAIVFTIFGLVLISWEAKESYVMIMFNLPGLLIAALIRGIVGPNGNLSNHSDETTNTP